MTFKPKILFIVSTFSRYEGDMQNPWMIDTFKRLKKRGYDIDILAPSFKGLKTHSVGEMKIYRWRYFFKKWESLTHDHGAPNKIRGSVLYKFMFFPYVIFGSIATFNICRKKKYNYIHCHWPFPQGVIGLFGLYGKPKPKLILHFHGASLLLANTYRYVDMVLNYLLKKADLVICNSNYTSDLVKKINNVSTHVIPYGTPLQYNPIPLPNNQTKEILAVGRIIERKGLIFLIKAIPKISIKINIKLYIVGSGDPNVTKQLRDEIEKLRLKEKITLTGKLSDEALIERYKNCDVFCLPAIVDSKGDTEGLGVVLLEALNYGRPIVSSGVGGITDIIKHEKTGLIANQKDPDDIAEKILQILLDPQKALKLATEGCSFAKENFNWDCIMKQWDDIYQL